MLPAGTAYRRAQNPEYAWSDTQNTLADIVDVLGMCLARLSGNRGELFPIVVRPSDVAAQKREIERARDVKKRLEETEWEEV